ncbi:6-phosphogluconolactonase-like [Ruditapes philippinarum]|uniref:6-phosphogluconolactonase-like n=1 Tax=Ruditapes philippinarum TaxID=129788 RepID=UPI00295BEB87|nr:6-phosphogluconolactonase-like [Ruditapes philippinarum]
MAAPMIICETDTQVAEKLCAFVIAKANESIKANGSFYVGLSGGSLVKYLCNGLPQLDTDWKKWRIFFCDERHVPYNSDDCTYTPYKQGLVDKVGMLENNIFPINPNLSVEDSAKDYASKIRQHFPGNDLPRFDMLLLGMGPDGHTCSLFPGHKLLEEKVDIIAPISDSPKPPPARVTMTFPMINNCRYAVFASCGESKAEMVQRVLEGNESPPLPAAQVRPTNGELHWFLDKPAASKLKNKL